MLRPLIKAQVASVALSLAGPWLHNPYGWAAWHASEWLSWGSIIGFAVIGVWNVVHPDHEAREKRLALRREQQRMIMEHAIMEHAAAGARARGWEKAVLDAQRAGTFSVNGVRQPGTTLRYQGPPPVYTPPGGFEMMITVELRAKAVVSAQERRSASECDMCGTPMDVALVRDGYPYLCRQCRRRAYEPMFLFR